MSDYNIIDTIDADQIEVGDYILIDDDPIRVTFVGDTSDPDEVLVKGVSELSGDLEDYPLPYNYPVDVWSLSE